MHPADSKFTDWLQWFCARKDSRYTIMSLYRNKDGRTEATNGWALVSVKDHPPIQEVEGRFPDTSPIIAEAKQAKYITVPVAELQAYCGPCEYMTVEKCSKCNGTGHKDHDCNCEFCTEGSEECNCEGGKVTESPEKRTGIYKGLRFDRNLLAYALEHLPLGETVELSTSKDKVFMRSDTWQYVLMGLVKGTEPEEPVEPLEFGKKVKA